MLMHSKPIDNLKLYRLVGDYNQVQLDLIDINDFFKDFLGINLFHFFIFGITIIFIAIDPLFEWPLRMAFLAVVAGFYITIIYIQSLIASSVLTEVNARCCGAPFTVDSSGHLL